MDPQTALKTLESALKELNSTSVGRRAFLQAAPFLLAACATAGEKNRYREGDNSGQEISITPADETKMTQEALTEMSKDYPPLQDREIQGYVSDVGNRLVNASGLRGNPYNYSFTVVDVNMVNAFALPAGTIFVTTPLLAMAETEAELAGVIGHEIGHVKARHAAERIEKAKREQNKGLFYMLGGGVLGGAAGFGIGKLVCPPKDQKCLQTATLAGAAAGVGGGLLIQKYKFMANSREDEMEADRVGFRTAVQAGYSKDHVGSFYAKLLKMEESRKSGDGGVLQSFADALSTHPPSRERVA
ncbi:MAG: M48 family metalloprotease, partial [Bdellovibrionaceae bacterium]|nr:M48 family metalloprotease [Pseudobdellovibrionaceae bacterium]